MKHAYQVIKTPIRTEKGALQQAQGNKYLFSVRNDANKIEIRRAVEELYKVKVESVNTVRLPGKLKRVRYQLGMTPDWKKAVVTLKSGQKIDFA
jgi:large subunit ribosomal protein L23